MFSNHFIFVNATVIENSCMFFFTVVLSRQLDYFCESLEVSSAKRVSYHVVLGLRWLCNIIISPETKLIAGRGSQRTMFDMLDLLNLNETTVLF